MTEYDFGKLLKDQLTGYAEAYKSIFEDEKRKREEADALVKELKEEIQMLKNQVNILYKRWVTSTDGLA